MAKNLQNYKNSEESSFLWIYHLDDI